MGEDENSEDWFSSEEVVTGSFSKEVVNKELRLTSNQTMGPEQSRKK